MANNTIARLVGYAFGDGSIHKKKQYFIYTNSNRELQEKVKNLIQNQFGQISLNIGTSISGTPRFQYSNVAGKFLVSRGAPIGSKVLQEIKVPDWIYKGNEEIKAEFLAAIFDDEGYFRDSIKCPQIVFKSAKLVSLKSNLEFYLKQLIKMIESLGIETSGIRKDGIKKRKDGTEIVSLRFWITKKDNFIHFFEKIPISHPEKRMKLLNMTKLASAG